MMILVISPNEIYYSTTHHNTFDDMQPIEMQSGAVARASSRLLSSTIIIGLLL